MTLVRIVGHKEKGQYVAHEVPLQKVMKIIKKLEAELGIIRVESRRIFPPHKFANNTKI